MAPGGPAAQPGGMVWGGPTSEGLGHDGAVPSPHEGADPAGSREVDRAARMRLFVAVDVPLGVRTAVESAVAPLRPLAPALRWTEPAQWHLTVAFLGGTPPGQLTEVREAVGDVAAAAHPFTLRLSGKAGTFRGGVLWAGLEEAPMLAELVEALRERVAPLGFDLGDEPFRGHLTLARASRGDHRTAEVAERYQGPRSPWTVRNVALMRSRLGIGGARYTVTQEWSLG